MLPHAPLEHHPSCLMLLKHRHGVGLRTNTRYLYQIGKFCSLPLNIFANPGEGNADIAETLAETQIVNFSLQRETFDLAVDRSIPYVWWKKDSYPNSKLTWRPSLVVAYAVEDGIWRRSALYKTDFIAALRRAQRLSQMATPHGQRVFRRALL
jgi:hypothetical protein